MAKAAMFAGLIQDEQGAPVEVAWVGETACYVVMDDDFKRHIDAASVDRQVLAFMKDQVDAQRGLAVESILNLMGKDDLFTKAAVESSIDRMDEAVGTSIPEEGRSLLGLLGFRIVIDFHGKVVEINLPEQGMDEGDY